jgi:hypothetical protein
MEIVIVVVVIGFVIAGIIYGSIAARKRREALAELGARLGLRFSPEHDTAIADRFHFLDRLSRGSDRYAFNILAGRWFDQNVLAFDYHYETHSRSSKGRRQTHHHYFSCFILLLPAHFPEVTITREGIFSKIAQAVGYDDIDFESAEFSRTFCVRSRDKRSAYDVCNPQMMEYLLANDDLNVEIENGALALLFWKCLAPAEIEFNLRRLLDIRARLPEYLFAKT